MIQLTQKQHFVYSISSSVNNQKEYLQNQLSNKSRQRSRYLQRNKYSNHKKNTCKHISISSQSDNNKKYGSSKRKSTAITYQHFTFISDQIINQKYRLLRILGQGSFGKVIQAEYNGTLYAIKFLKPHYKSIQYGEIEARIIKTINCHDQEDNKGIVRLIEKFRYRDYFCLVFESLGKNLYKAIQQNSHIGFNMKLVQSFFKQVLISIGFLHSLGYTHTDIKPQNIVLSSNAYTTRFCENTQQSRIIIQPACDKIKLIDLGNAVHDSQYHISLINTRQYRSPQVILGCCKWNNSSDVWAIGCMMIQLLTGKLTFPVKQDIQHLHLMKKLLGQFPKWMLNRAQKYNDIFKKSKSSSHCILNQIKSQRIQTINQQISKYKQFKTLIFRCLQIDPNKRITCQQALQSLYFNVQY